MLRRQAFPFQWMPNGQETRYRRQFAGSYRWVYNKALAINAHRYERNEKRLGYAELCALLPGWKREHPFLSDVPAAGIAALKNLERAYTNFFPKRPLSEVQEEGQRESFRRADLRQNVGSLSDIEACSV
jgi:putative transposase